MSVHFDASYSTEKVWCGKAGAAINRPAINIKPKKSGKPRKTLCLTVVYLQMWIDSPSYNRDRYIPDIPLSSRTKWRRRTARVSPMDMPLPSGQE
jgi:hypothetical protein